LIDYKEVLALIFPVTQKRLEYGGVQPGTPIPNYAEKLKKIEVNG